MTTQETPEILDNDENSPSGLRATIDRLQAKVKEQDAELADGRAEKRDRILDDAGLDPVARKAIAKDIERGDFKDELTIETVRTFASSEYGVELVSDAPPAVPDDAAERLASQQARDDVRASSVPVGETDDSPEANQAEADKLLEEGDVQGAVLTELQSKVDSAT